VGEIRRPSATADSRMHNIGVYNPPSALSFRTRLAVSSVRHVEALHTSPLNIISRRASCVTSTASTLVMCTGKEGCGGAEMVTGAGTLGRGAVRAFGMVDLARRLAFQGERWGSSSAMEATERCLERACRRMTSLRIPFFERQLFTNTVPCLFISPLLSHRVNGCCI
jgi:hypothetical protein